MKTLLIIAIFSFINPNAQAGSNLCIGSEVRSQAQKTLQTVSILARQENFDSLVASSG